MSSVRIALIACSNGLGHVRRMLSLSLALRARGASPVLLAPKDAVLRLSMVYGIPIPEVINFESRTMRSDWLASDACCWADYLPPLDDFDEVVSDNLVEILALRPKAWLSGSFFWHMALQNFPPHKAAIAEELLAQHRPRMISTGLFAARYLAAKTNLVTVGLYALGRLVRANLKSDLLISCGRGGEAENETNTLIKSIASGDRPGNYIVWVEPTLYSYGMPRWIRPASYTPDMYSRLVAAAIRPGVGTATEALLAGARLFMFHESGSLEMAHNARQIAKNGFGGVYVSAKDAWRALVDFAKRREAMAEHANSLQELDCDGADQAACLLLKSLN